MHCKWVYVPRVGNTGERVIPRHECGNDAEAAASLLQRRAAVDLPLSLGEVGAREHQEGQVQGEEQQEEHDGRPQRAQQQDGREDEPAHQEETDYRKLVVVGAVPVQGMEGGRLEDGVRNPEASVRRQRRGAKGVAHSHLPTSR